MNNNRRTIKSFTRSALLISMILHAFFLISLFYYVVSNEAIFPVQDKIAVTLSTVPRSLTPKTPIKPITRQRVKTKYETTKPLATVESINPQNAFTSNLAPTTPIITEQPRLEDTKTSPDVNVNVSTALNKLLQVESGLSAVEAAQPTLGASLGEKRSGMQGVHRGPTRSTLNVAGSTGVDGGDATQIGGFLEKKPLLPNIEFGNVMRSLASQIVGTSEGGPIDVVFVIDSSGSMQDNIYSVANHLVNMIDVYKSSDIDYELGLTQFSTYRDDKGTTKNAIQVLQLTKDMDEYRRDVKEIVIREDENALDAILKTVFEMQFRATSKKHLIVVTDEPFTSMEGKTAKDVIDACREFGIYVNVLGLPEKEHQALASETNGKWHAIPEKQGNQLAAAAAQRSTASTTTTKADTLRKATWENIRRVGMALIQNTRNEPVDIILFIDGSKSMEDKLPHFLKQLDEWVRDWDNALIDYQLGAVRFRSDDSGNMVDVSNPPQSLDQIRKIVELPCQDDEFLLHAIVKAYGQLELRDGAKTHLILVTDEPIAQTSKTADVIQFLEKKHIIVSVVGTFDGFQEEVTIKTGGAWVPIPQGHLTNDVNW